MRATNQVNQLNEWIRVGERWQLSTSEIINEDRKVNTALIQFDIVLIQDGYCYTWPVRVRTTQHLPESHCEPIKSLDCSTILFSAIVSYMSHSLMGTIKTGPLLYPCRSLHHWALNECRAAFKAGHYHLPNILSCLTVLIRICERGDSAEKSINLTNLTSLEGSS